MDFFAGLNPYSWQEVLSCLGDRGVLIGEAVLYAINHKQYNNYFPSAANDTQLNYAYSGIPLKWTTLGPKILSASYSEVSLAQGLVVDHAAPTIVACYDKELQKRPY